MRDNQIFAIVLLLVLLPAEADLILEEVCYKRDMVRSLCSGNGKIIFTLLIEVVAGHMVITTINVRKTGLEKTFIRGFSIRGSGFHYCTNDVLYVLIYVTSWRHFKAYRSCDR